LDVGRSISSIPEGYAAPRAIRQADRWQTAYFGPFRSLILVLSDHPFWNIPIIDSDFIRSFFLVFQNQ
jgi:hypothetical protein